MSDPSANTTAAPATAATEATPPGELVVADDEEVYTVTEAARLARVSVQALRQRISRGTLRTTRVVRDRRMVAGIPARELARAYPEVAEVVDDAPGRAEAEAAEREAQEHRRVVVQLRRKLAREREIRARLQGVVEDQERRLDEFQVERMRLERRVAELDSRLVFLDGQTHDELPPPAWWRRGVVWARLALAAVVVTTFLSAGTAYWRQLDARFQVLVESLRGPRDAGSVAAAAEPTPRRDG